MASQPMRGSDYTPDDIDTLVRQLCKFLHRQHGEHHSVVVDFDVMAVFLMQEMGPKLHIRKIVLLLLQQFESVISPTKKPNTSSPPQTSIQSQLLQAAEAVYTRIQDYDDGLSTSKPFCLRYPTYSAVLEHSKAMQNQCDILPNDRMVVLLDEAGVCVGVGVPPNPASSGRHMKPDIRAKMTLDDTVSTSSWDTLDGAAKSKGMHDLKIKITKKQIDLDELQGYKSLWRTKPFTSLLPNPLRESQNTLDVQAMAKFRNEITYYSKLSLWINKAFLPKAASIAEDAITYLKQHGSDLLRDNLANEKNLIIASRTISVNHQVHTHRDKKNALLFDSACFFGNHNGGEFLLPTLGVAYPGLHGYSFHGPLRILLHGVARFHFPANLHEPPRRYSVAFWSRASSFAAVARDSADRDGKKVKTFSSTCVAQYES
ncbi:uncharacterized protein PGTG_18923 [Puccinia graminis f. sp. tritici CRL 75-36-700-3]|uniref:Uncharacterized protein n=1 Tax=Puccinia graminis f. sp. tritici (strain CRL 75-36-700-3 / race SCCL) TaxID=418459 RepID=E3LAD4_PUCGT|nr:uncharacterized protein PGTG_18923 [Puccinia graminis f. sp. tritici CRL 75-36-700-3]EFP93509.2 hypothetical protein PGTG_18923 [Puccinia graminis f. sp. tritici CRL 75-36-700-3]